MRLVEKKFYTTYKVLRNKKGDIIDLLFYNQYETLEGKKTTFKNNLNDSKLLNDYKNIKTYYDKKIELASFIDYELKRVNENITIIDRVKNKIVKNLSSNEVMDYILEINNKYNAIYQYNNNIVVLR